MLKYSFLILFFLVFFTKPQAQVKYETKKYPVSKVYFWKDKGVLLYGDDPKGLTLLKECTMITGEEKPLWNKTIMPIVDNPKAVFSESSDYLYFLDEIKPEVGKLSFNQFHRAGTLKKNNLALNSRFFEIGKNIDLNNLTILTATSTKYFLVVLFEYFESSNSEYKYALALIKHVTFKMDLFWVPEIVVTKNDIKNYNKGTLRLVGDIDGQMVFSQPESTENFLGKNHFMFDEEGTFTKRKQLQWPEKGKYPLMSYDIDILDGSLIGGNLEIDYKKNPDLSHQGGEKTINDFKYVYGFYSNEKPEGKNTNRTGVYIIKYDVNGNIIWSRFMPFSNKLVEDKSLIEKNTVLGQSLIADNGNLSLTFGYDTKIFNLIVSENEGKDVKTIEEISGAGLEDIQHVKYHIMLNRLGKNVPFKHKIFKINNQWYQEESLEGTTDGTLILIQ